VWLNGHLVRNPDGWLDPKRDRIRVDGKIVRPRADLYFAMNRPSGVVTTRSDELQRRSVWLCTNNTRLGKRSTNPLEDIPKTYAAKLDRKLTRREVARIVEVRAE
jgi:23S rRNA pseudouridine2605 synthase